ncbi:sulfurtransferase [Kineosporia mesophila]|uniref:thiosulfate sulfurtransferase n=1 Tax=Kineosporia mesophila TaxID=566012 RepID=A0ABP7AD04_9ACTN|nr:sulfurtransferase [Kineosporia mesophila]MCD5351226.1 sulfurtransferase [Kineosporia mesophila]
MSLEPSLPAGSSGAEQFDRPSGPPLVDADWLATHRQDVVLFQVDDDSAAYYENHIPGALPLATYDELYERVRRSPLTRTHFEELMQVKGVRPEDHVVFYSAGDGNYAAFAYWLMRLYGHRRLSLLDGGLQGWIRKGRRTDTEVPDVAVVPSGPGYRSSGLNSWAMLERDELLRSYVERPHPALLLDCRTPAEYEGSGRHALDLPVERHRVTGHIAGSRNVPSGSMLQGPYFRPVDELREAFAEAGLTAESDVAVYCRVAERSSLLWFVLSELLHHPRVRHYVGGWAEYGSLVNVPVARS